MSRFIKILKSATLFGIASVLMAGCVQTQIKDLSQVKSDDVVFIGRIEFEPKISKDEILVKNTIGGGDVYRTFLIKASDKYYELEGSDAGDMDDTIAVMTEEDYYVTGKRNKPFIIMGGWFYTRLTGGAQITRETMLYKIGEGIKVDYKPGAKAVYIGTIHFKRDEFFKIKDIKISQADFKNAQVRFQKKYKTDWKLVKAKLTSAK